MTTPCEPDVEPRDWSAGVAGGRSPFLVVLAVAGAAVVGLDPAGWFPFSIAKWWMVMTTLSVGAVLAVWSRPAGAGHTGRSWFVFVMTSLAFVVTLSAVFARDGWYAWIGTPVRHLGAFAWWSFVLAFVVGDRLGRVDSLDATTPISSPTSWSHHRVGRRRPTEGVVDDGAELALVVVSLLLGAYVVWELAVGRPIDIDSATDRLGGPFGSAAYLGAMCCLLLPPALGGALDARWTAPRRRMAVVASVALVVALVGSGSRSAILGAAFGCTMWVGVARIVRRRDAGRAADGSRSVPSDRARLGVAPPRPSRRREAGRAADRACASEASGIRLGAAAASAAMVGGAGWMIARDVFERTRGASSRLDEWRLALRVIAERPVLGVGPEGYRIAAFEQMGDAYAIRYGDDVVVDRAHSGILDVASSSGVVAAGLYVVALVLVVRLAVRAMAADTPASAGLAAGVVAFAIGQQFLFPIAEIDPVFWLLVGVVHGRDRSISARPAVAFDRDESRARRARRSVATVAPAVVAVALVVFGVRAVAADRLAADAVASSDVPNALASAERARTLAPADVRHDLLASELSSVRGSLNGVLAALEAVDDAARTSPLDPAVRLERARVLALLAAVTGSDADRERAALAWERLVADAPSCARCHLGRGLAAAERGDVDLARRSLERARELGAEEAAPLLDELDVSGG